MTCCMLVMSWPPTGVGGVNEAVLGLAGALQLGSQLKPVIAITSWSPIPLPREVRGIPVVGLQLHDGYDAGLWPAVKSATRLPADLVAISNVLKTHDVQVVNLHFPTLGGAAAFLLLRRLGIYRGKVVLTFHGADIREANSSRSFSTQVVWKSLINRADNIFVCSEALANEVRVLSPQRNVQVIYNGADIALFSSVVRLRVSGRKRILNIARFERKKSQDVLLAAFRLLLDHGLDCVLTMIGTDGPTLEQVRRAATAFDGRVRILVGVPHEQIPEYMADCDLFVLPSRAEGFPIVLIEAGAAGLPVVATSIPGIVEFIKAGVTGLLVEPDNSHALAEAMARILGNDELGNSLASKLRAEALHFTWQQAANQFVAAVS
jgi:glycosyltransferase involved in cell wall biosynthesis